VSWLRESETLLGQVERALADMFGPSHPGALSARALLGHVLLTGGFITQVGGEISAVQLVGGQKQATPCCQCGGMSPAK
jgi:hypothetical protein